MGWGEGGVEGEKVLSAPVIANKHALVQPCIHTQSNTHTDTGTHMHTQTHTHTFTAMILSLFISNQRAECVREVLSPQKLLS